LKAAGEPEVVECRCNSRKLPADLKKIKLFTRNE